jgi:hypothetical protein
MRSSRDLVLIGVLLLADGTSATAQTQNHDGDTWGGRRHRATEAQIESQERAAGVASTPSRATSDAVALDRIYRQLIRQGRPAS